MEEAKVPGIADAEFLEPLQETLVQRLSHGKNRKYVRFLVAALGSIPWIGGFIAASASLTAERGGPNSRNSSPPESDRALPQGAQQRPETIASLAVRFR